ncbi:MAG: ABC transporter permease subunit [Streptosporangiales bacterium]|nr:ABC transporter permease subunit [Streptosporangiales bacterium]
MRTKGMLAGGATITLVLGTLFPLYWGVRTSLVANEDRSLFPTRPTLEGYYYVFHNGDFANAIINSSIVAVGAVIVTVPLAVLAGFALARFDFAGRRYGSLILLLPLVPAVAVLVPLIVYMRSLGMYNTLYAVILGASVFTLPFAIWMIRSFMLSVPMAVEEAALLDGCTRLGALLRVMLPLIAPGLVTASVFVFITAWNNYIYAVAFTTSEQLRVVPVAILGFITSWGTNYSGMNAAATLAMLPPLAFFLLFQKWFVQGLLAGTGR